MDYRSSEIPKTRLFRDRTDDGHARVGRPRRPPRERERQEFKELVEKEDDDKDSTKKSLARSKRRGSDKKPSIFDLSSEHENESTALIPKKGKDAREDIALGSGDGKITAVPQWAVTGNEAVAASSTAGGKGAIFHSTQAQEVIEQIAKEMALIQRSDRSETSLTLKFPPVFAGAQVNITEFKSARGEFNITFSNLTQEAKALIDNQANLNALRQGLEHKGFALHIVNSTTEPAPIASAEAEQKRDSQNQEGEQQGQGRQGKEKEEKDQQPD